MAVKIIGTVSGQEVDSDATPKAMRVSLYDAAGQAIDINPDNGLEVQTRPPAFGALGAYSKGLTTGLIAATGAANALILALRWADATRFALIERVRVNAVVTATITAAVPYNLQLFVARGFTVNPTTNIGITGTLSGNNAKRRTTGMGTALMGTTGGIFILGTAAAGMTGQTMGNDTDPIGVIAGASGTVIGTQFFGGIPVNLWDADPASRHPLILAQNEGLAIQAPLAGPATGTFQVSVSVDWMEVAAY
jgi:hypothetical protein